MLDSSLSNHSNSLIKNFKKSKGVEFQESKKKRKQDTAPIEVPFAKKAKIVHKTTKRAARPLPPTKFVKPDWKQVRLNTKLRKIKRKERKVGGKEQLQLLNSAVKFWEELRHSNCNKERRYELCKEISKLVQGNVRSWLKLASGNRIIEHLVAYGDEEIRELLFCEVNTVPVLLEMMTDSHEQHFLLKMLRHGSKRHRQCIISAMEFQIVRLTKHKVACKVVEVAYSDFATATQRANMMQEFYGPYFKYFNSKEFKSLSDVLAKHPSKKEAILKEMQKGLQIIMQKGIFNNSLILGLLRDYLMFCDEAERQNVIGALEDGLLTVIHTKDGARIAMTCLWHGSAKQRKNILKSFKEHLLEVATWDHSNMVLMAALDCVDDTKFLAKAILIPLMKEANKLFESENGIRVFRYMVLGRNSTYFHPHLLDILKLGDNNPTSKKDALLRRKEIQSYISEGLLEILLRNIEFWSRNSQWTLFLGPAIGALATASHKMQAMEALAKHCGEKMPDGVNSLIDISHSSKMLNYVISCDVKNKLEKMPLFSLVLLKHAEENLSSWLSCNRGCFLFVRLLETGIGRVIYAVHEFLKGKLASVNAIKNTSKGSEILLQKLKETKRWEASDSEDDVPEHEALAEEESIVNN